MPGICLHLIPEEQVSRAAAQSEAEILHSNLAALWIELLQWGCRQSDRLTRLDLPPEKYLRVAQQLLTQRDARSLAVAGDGRSARSQIAVGGQPCQRAAITFAHMVTTSAAG